MTSSRDALTDAMWKKAGQDLAEYAAGVERTRRTR
jgi:hypothetical protein